MIPQPRQGSDSDGRALRVSNPAAFQVVTLMAYKGTIQSSSDEIDLGSSPLRPEDSQKRSGGPLQYAGADYIDTNESEIKPPYSDPGNKGPVQMGGADEVELRRGGATWPFANQAKGVVSKSGAD